jgi:hypothetical protein
MHIIIDIERQMPTNASERFFLWETVGAFTLPYKDFRKILPLGDCRQCN